jgi:hypothetical protein
MEMPTARPAIVNISGKVDATAKLGPLGKPTGFHIRSDIKVLANEVEFLLKYATTYAAACSGEKLGFVFVYRVEGEPLPDVVGKVFLQPPNRFVIVARPFIPIAEVVRQ